ncbi:NAD(P)H-binding protein [Burkholderia multivorans]|uniref:NAD-dependent epimerase/dehydratase n=1 Tax=Burkholderia multivorans CGD2 TaxID=513052 RepID=B9BXD0_9BURK|nr:NAD(P)H-binding protein [Burkholderia multivorans]AIO76475.1 NAD dependent epimerase/dehydratase family protein [Burkholderia multivorans]AOK67172.1 3-beta hydroxysteroid dehydrogenase [Burkholderia multivorans]EEE04640.1 NAD-dependent epimerase/dehydratase [Burkholderia multivorans CGD2]KVQ75375.1 3-beta hydroxysteroid dehydrogenase [Burkholderia multivorans]KVZ82170.1 3-beta hydroxysteroid dehydrogenase [Burkholderia multivorans]
MTQPSLNIALFGATGMIGSRIAAEAARRGHRVTALSRRPGAAGDGITAKAADLFDPASVAAALPGHDVVASAYGPKQDDAANVVAAVKALVEGARRAGLKRVVVVGGAGSLEVAPGKQLVDTEGFPAEYKAVALAHRDALDYLKTVDDLDWTFFAPAALIAPGERTGTFRTGTGKLIVDANGDSRISAEDYAVAFVDALEQRGFVREIATVAY